MKKSATTLVEILIAMTLMIVLTVICMTGLRVFVSKDTDIVKFKHVYGSVSAAVYELINDVIMYPSAKGFADTSEHSYNEETKVYGGKDKFKKLFKSKFNIYNNVVIDMGVEVPLAMEKITHFQTPQDIIQYDYTTSNKISCFIDNKAFTFCPPETPEYSNSAKKRVELESIYLPVFISKMNFKNLEKTATIDKAVFIRISKNGKIEVPAIIENNKGPIINCTQKSFNTYSQCKVIDKMGNMDL